MDNFWKRVQAIKELYPSVTSNQGNVSYDDDLNVVETDETAIANKITEQDTARENEKQANEIKEVMETCVKLEVPSKVDVDLGESWGG
jgi:hypothetical protein